MQTNLTPKQYIGYQLGKAKTIRMVADVFSDIKFDASAHRSLAVTFREDEHFDEAVEECQKSLHKCDNDTDRFRTLVELAKVNVCIAREAETSESESVNPPQSNDVQEAEGEQDVKGDQDAERGVIGDEDGAESGRSELDREGDAEADSGDQDGNHSGISEPDQEGNNTENDTGTEEPWKDGQASEDTVSGDEDDREAGTNEANHEGSNMEDDIDKDEQDVEVSISGDEDAGDGGSEEDGGGVEGGERSRCEPGQEDQGAENDIVDDADGYERPYRTIQDALEIRPLVKRKEIDLLIREALVIRADCERKLGMCDEAVASIEEARQICPEEIMSGDELGILAAALSVDNERHHELVDKLQTWGFF